MLAPHAIVFVAPFGLEQKTTVWARTLPLARRLVARGHSATILIPPWDSPAAAGWRLDDDGVRLEHMDLHGGVPFVVARMLRRIAELAPDIVHVVKPRAHAGLVQWWLWRRPRPSRPLLVLDVDDWEQAWAPINRYPWPVARFLAWQEEWGIRHADGITAASRWLVERAGAAAPAIPSLYLPNGITPPAPAAIGALSPVGAETRDPGPKVLYFSRFVEVDPTWLTRFWHVLRTHSPGAELLIAGQALAPWLEGGVRRALAGAPGVRWLGYIPPGRLPNLYAEAACAVFPAAPIPLHQAKCSVRLATTLMHGVPVVASAVGEQAAYGAAGAAHLVPAEATPEEFAAAVARVLAAPEQRAALRQAAHTRLLARYHWDRLVDDLEAFYDTLARPQAE